MKPGTLLRVLVVFCILAAAISAAAWARSGVQHRAAPANQPSHTIIWVTLKIGGAEVAGFFKDWSLESGVDPSALSLNPGKPLKLPKEITPPSLTIKRGFDNDLTLSKWHEAALRGDPSAPADVVVTGLDYLGEPVAVWHLTQAWPSKYEVGTTGDSETVTIVAEKLERVG